MQLIINIPEEVYKKAKETHDVMCDKVWLGIKYGTPLDSVRAEIVKDYEDATMYSCDEELSRFASRVCGILSRIGKPESEDEECEKNT